MTVILIDFIKFLEFFCFCRIWIFLAPSEMSLGLPTEIKMSCLITAFGLSTASI